MAGNRFSSKTSRTALVGILSACSLAFLWLASITPTGRLGIAAVAGLFPVAAVLACDRKAGFLCCAASGILGLIIVPDKGVSLLYAAFFGLYPVLKSLFERQKRTWLVWLCKLGYFNVVLAVFWFFFRALFLPHVPEWLDSRLVLLLGNIIFVLYDIGLSRLIFGLLHRFQKGGRSR